MMTFSKIKYSLNLWKTLSKISRNFSEKTLIIRKKPRKKNAKKSSSTTQSPDESKTAKMKKSKKSVKLVTRCPSDYSEELWLSDVNLDNLKLYRKTSFGSFRKINVNNLLEKLNLNSSSVLLEQEKNVVVVDGNVSLNESSIPIINRNKMVDENMNELATPHMSDYLITNMLSFPLSKPKFPNALASVFKEEKDDFGVVDSKKFPSVTAILHDTMSEASAERLEMWKKQKLLELGEDGFNKFTKDSLNQGQKFHSCLKSYLESDDKENYSICDKDVEKCWMSLNHVLPDIDNVKLIEKPVYHPVLMYRGVLDCVASYRNVPCVIEWKKSEKLKTDVSSTYDAPLQLCAYLGALSWLKLEKNLPPLTNGLVVVAYNTGVPANVFQMDYECCQYYWNKWLKRLQKYWLKKSTVLLTRDDETSSAHQV
ncbi:conserved hypothetical protein [Pediculus humanus corporis]|uniref:Mitochondrial genome maintenance exonuclease 1 n=1 Tax=Pediculus humanus subsp. corporis TaxID=121224 RepID=E0VLE6_PEDHC|nr:uncharacterized protein Phum_PHUM286980 [Pediculus humanus corporis]EEB14202.1 conserved hypothetical protein [Pediculus humanus corporis]